MPEVKSYLGSWCFKPDVFEQPEEREKYTFNGLLSCPDGESATLEIVHSSEEYHEILIDMMIIPTIWGKDTDGNLYTLFNSAFIQDKNTTKTTYRINFVLNGAFLKDLDTPFAKRAHIHYPHLKNWAFRRRFSFKPLKNGKDLIKVDMHSKENLFSCKLEDGLSLELFPEVSTHFDRYNASVSCNSSLSIISEKKLKLRQILSLTTEFSQFLSVALFSRQRPESIVIKTGAKQPGMPLLFKVDVSQKPCIGTLIKFDKFPEKIPSIYSQWHANYKQLSPIVERLIRSMTPGIFDAPDFLIIAQALDGYFKRFVNKKDGKDHRQYGQGIKILLEHFKEVELLQKCDLDPKELTNARNKYSHLYSDDEYGFSNVPEGEDLLWLTKKSIVLLTCCILECIGLNNEEINLCFRGSEIQAIVDTIPKNKK